MEATLNSDFSLTEKKSGKLPILSAVLCVIYLPVCWALGWIDFAESGPAVQAILSAPLYAMGIFAILVSPMHGLGYEAMANRSRGGRLLIAFVLLSCPLFAFGYFQGGVRHGGDLHEISLIVFPAVLASLLVYEATRRPELFVAMLFLWTYPSFFLVNDALGAFPVPFLYYTQGEGAHYLRTLSPMLALGWVAINFRDRLKILNQPESIAYLLVGLGAIAFWVDLLLPAVMAYLEKEPLVFRVHYRWIGFLVTAGVLYTTKSFRMSATLLGGLFAYDLWRAFWGFDEIFWRQTSFLGALLTGSVIGLGWKRGSPTS